MSALKPFAFATITVGATVGLLVNLGPAETASAPPVAQVPNAATTAPAPTAETSQTAPAATAAVAVASGASRNFELAADGTAVPMLGMDAPPKVRLAVALFRYSGAEGAGVGARDRQAAEELARSAIARTLTDGRFDGAVALGDAGSTRDLGWVPRGILERRVEHAVFTLPVGSSLPEPLDTPRGFWVVRRLK